MWRWIAMSRFRASFVCFVYSFFCVLRLCILEKVGLLSAFVFCGWYHFVVEVFRVAFRKYLGAGADFSRISLSSLHISIHPPLFFFHSSLFSGTGL